MTLADADHPPPEILYHSSLWWRDWFSSAFFVAALGSVWGVFLVQKTEVWTTYSRHIINFCQQFPAMTLTETASFILLELHMTGVVRETVAFVISQFTEIRLPFELILPVDARMYSEKYLQTLLTMSRHEYPIHLTTGEWVEEPLFHVKNQHSLYSLPDRIRIHGIFRQLIHTYSQQISYSVWRQWLHWIDTAFSANPPPDNDLALYQQLEDLLVHPSDG